ncbi:MAG: UDP-N-acetylmuramoyl-tripeptide--D-alanyl-D-alanine ligase, partial [bacterium]
AILGVRHTVVKTPGNYNNEIGMPLTLMQLDEHTETAVVEFGMRGPGQIGYLAALALPTVGVITNIGSSHLELLGTREDIARAKAELLEGMPQNSTVILPGEDDFFEMLRDSARGPIVTVGESPDFDLWASDVTLGDTGNACFTMHFRGHALPIVLAVPGRHQVNNALSAAAAALAAGGEVEDIAIGLAGYTGIDGRMQTHKAPRGFTIVDDTYNAHPAAVRATLDHLAEIPGNAKMAILGDMRELGPDAADLHRELGAYAMEKKIDHLFAIGELGREYIDGANSPNAQWFPDHNSAVQAALEILQPGDIVLVKGSRAMKMEEIVRGLMAE